MCGGGGGVGGGSCSHAGRIELVVLILKLVILPITIFVVEEGVWIIFEVVQIRLFGEDILQGVRFAVIPVTINNATRIGCFPSTPTLPSPEPLSYTYLLFPE